MNLAVRQRGPSCSERMPCTVAAGIVPVISAAGTVPGFYLASGFSGHGFGIGPAAGRLMADLVLNRTPLVDPSAFRFGRFSDGSKIELISGF